MAVLAGILVIGVPLDVIAGYKGGMIDGITMRMVDIVCTFPSSLVGLAVVGILDPGLQIIMLVLVSLWWAPLARMVRGEVLQIREEGYITAAKANGLSDVVIIFRHIHYRYFNATTTLADFSSFVVTTKSLMRPHGISHQSFLVNLPNLLA